MRLLLFCSAVKEIAPEYNDAARSIVRAACGKGYEIVSGGTIKGTMGVVCDEASKCGARVIGILPRFMKGLEHPGLTSLEWTDTMSERKEKMREGADLVVALPGGIGTMDELFETMVLSKLGRFGGRIAVYNPGGFYDPLEELLDHFVATNMLKQEHKDLVRFCSSVEEVTALL